MKRQAVRFAFSALTALVLLSGCERDDEGIVASPAPPQTVGTTQKVPEARKAEFKSMVVHASFERLAVNGDGGLVATSSGTLELLIDAESNRSRMSVTSTTEEDNVLEIFDGRLLWRAAPAEKSIYGSAPVWPNYVVWDQLRPVERQNLRPETVRGLEMGVVKSDKGIFWYYKGVNVQFQRNGKKSVLRTALQDIQENVPVPEHAFDLPKDLTKIEY